VIVVAVVIAPTTALLQSSVGVGRPWFTNAVTDAEVTGPIVPENGDVTELVAVAVIVYVPCATLFHALFTATDWPIDEIVVVPMLVPLTKRSRP
jgi:hypothetical protein